MIWGVTLPRCHAQKRLYRSSMCGFEFPCSFMDGCTTSSFEFLAGLARACRCIACARSVREPASGCSFASQPHLKSRPQVRGNRVPRTLTAQPIFRSGLMFFRGRRTFFAGSRFSGPIAWPIVVPVQDGLVVPIERFRYLVLAGDRFGAIQ